MLVGLSCVPSKLQIIKFETNYLKWFICCIKPTEIICWPLKSLAVTVGNWPLLKL